MISERISDDIPPQMKNFNMVIPILMHFCSFISNWSVESCHPTNCDVINDVKRFPAVYRRIYCCKYLTLSNQKSRYKSNCIRIILYLLGSNKKNTCVLGNLTLPKFTDET